MPNPSRSPHSALRPARRGASLPSGAADRTAPGLLLAWALLLALPLGGAAAQEGDATAARGPLPACRYDDVPARPEGYDAWDRVVLDTVFALPADYAPPDLVDVAEAGLAPGRLVRALMIDDLRALAEAAAANGTPIELQSAYRSHGYQERTFAYWVERDGRDAALRTSARPGHSEHQLGTAIDVRSAGGPAPWDLEDWGATPAGAWMAENAWRYGFVLSYPAGSESETCYAYEPWHWRYVGRETAARIRASGRTPRAWLWDAAGGTP